VFDNRGAGDTPGPGGGCEYWNVDQPFFNLNPEGIIGYKERWATAPCPEPPQSPDVASATEGRCWRDEGRYLGREGMGTKDMDEGRGWGEARERGDLSVVNVGC
jgi:hypothetical protein